MYVLIDRASRNVMAECSTFVEAESALLELVGTYPPAAHDLEIVGPGGLRQGVSREQVERAASAAAEVAGA
ncbi:MAG TPA: hypothetical protein VFL66_03875 [Gaiellaceae bacterium]|nr:hypothetical protein [Gaiellaceae bacterium]